MSAQNTGLVQRDASKLLRVNLDFVRERLARLLEEGEAVLKSRYRSGLSHQEFVEQALFRQWRVGAIAFMREALGADSPYLKEFEFCCDSPYLTAAVRGQAVMKAVREYIDFGPVSRVEELVAAEIFGDLLGVAARLLKEGHAAAAVAVAGAALEDVLRRNARNRRIKIAEGVEKIGELNTKLAGAGVYPAAVEKKIKPWAGLIERAENDQLAHDSRAEVERMLAGVRSFVNDYLV